MSNETSSGPDASEIIPNDAQMPNLAEFGYKLSLKSLCHCRLIWRRSQSAGQTYLQMVCFSEFGIPVINKPAMRVPTLGLLRRPGCRLFKQQQGWSHVAYIRSCDVDRMHAAMILMICCILILPHACGNICAVVGMTASGLLAQWLVRHTTTRLRLMTNVCCCSRPLFTRIVRRFQLAAAALVRH